MATELVKRPVESEDVAVTPVELLRMAVSQGADLDKLSKLMDLQERWEKTEARKAFVSAMNAFKASPPEITKNKTVSYGTGDKATSYRHATLDHVCHAVTQGLSQHGISHRWKVEQADGIIKVTCILTHDRGHSEETTLQGAADTSGSKNSIQAIGSTVTYLQRYTLLAATGLAAAGQDTDGATVTNGELAQHLDNIAKAETPELMKAAYTKAYAMFEEKPDAIRLIVKARKDATEVFNAAD